MYFQAQQEHPTAKRTPAECRILKLDMEVRWSSTYSMLNRAYEDRVVSWPVGPTIRIH